MTVRVNIPERWRMFVHGLVGRPQKRTHFNHSTTVDIDKLLNVLWWNGTGREHIEEMSASVFCVEPTECHLKRSKITIRVAITGWAIGANIHQVPTRVVEACCQ